MLNLDLVLNIAKDCGPFPFLSEHRKLKEDYSPLKTNFPSEIEITCQIGYKWANDSFIKKVKCEESGSWTILKETCIGMEAKHRMSFKL